MWCYWPFQPRQCGGGGSGSRGDKGSKGADDGRSGVDEVTVEEDVVLVVKGHKKKTLWLTGITAKNLPDQFSIVPSFHVLWSS